MREMAAQPETGTRRAVLPGPSDRAWLAATTIGPCPALASRAQAPLRTCDQRRLHVFEQGHLQRNGGESGTSSGHVSGNKSRGVDAQRVERLLPQRGCSARNGRVCSGAFDGAASFSMSVARSASKLVTLRTGGPSGVCLLAAFACVLSETCACSAGDLRQWRARLPRPLAGGLAGARDSQAGGVRTARSQTKEGACMNCEERGPNSEAHQVLKALEAPQQPDRRDKIVS